jgi:hypothetical protein
MPSSMTSAFWSSPLVSVSNAMANRGWSHWRSLYCSCGFNRRSTT